MTEHPIHAILHNRKQQELWGICSLARYSLFFMGASFHGMVNQQLNLVQ
jgi:hypothetical protein